jgi:1-acyl-sn-glycerol-3-phosphate acyltransferase
MLRRPLDSLPGVSRDGAGPELRSWSDDSWVRGRPRVQPWYLIGELILLPFLLLFTRHTWLGARHIPASGPVILAPNHMAYADPATLGHFVLHGAGRHGRFLVKEALFSVPVIGRLMDRMQVIPVRRGAGDASQALDAALEHLQRGECIVLYPEGTITKDPDLWPMRARTGIARLALATGAPVVPVGHWGAQRVYGRDGSHHLLRRNRVTTRAGAPVDLSRWQGLAVDATVLEEVTAEIMRHVTAIVADLRGEDPPGTVFDLRVAG